MSFTARNTGPTAPGGTLFPLTGRNSLRRLQILIWKEHKFVKSHKYLFFLTVQENTLFTFFPSPVSPVFKQKHKVYDDIVNTGAVQLQPGQPFFWNENEHYTGTLEHRYTGTLEYLGMAGTITSHKCTDKNIQTIDQTNTRMAFL